MSGGSYDYLYLADDVDFLAEKKNELNQMHDRLAALPWAQVAADETMRLINALARLDSYVRNSAELRKVWKEIEYWDSGDSSEAQAREAARRYEELSQI